jgi:hypothetical protein
MRPPLRPAGSARTAWPARLASSARPALLLLLAASVVAMKILSLACIYPGLPLSRISAIVQDPQSTGYYTDARALTSADTNWAWLADYPNILTLPGLHLHTISKPPGPLVYYMHFIRALGNGRPSAIAAGVWLAILAAAAVPAVYWLIRVLSGNADVAAVAAIILCLCPGFVLIYPTFDAAYVLPTAFMLAAWHLALQARPFPALAWLLVSAAAASVWLFMSYAPLVLCFFMAGDAMVTWKIGRQSAWALLWRAAVMLAGVAAVYGIFFLLSGYPAIQTFRVAMHNQRLLLALHPQDRPYPWTILFDLSDFVFSAAWLTLLPAVIALAFLRQTSPSRRWLLILAVAQPLVVALSGQLQSETARVWNFMLPLLILPAAIELARWRPWARGVFYLSLLLVLLVVGQNMVFLNPPPPLSN